MRRLPLGGMQTCRALRALMLLLSCAWLRSVTAASRLKAPALPIQSEKELLPAKGLSGETETFIKYNLTFKCIDIFADMHLLINITIFFGLKLTCAHVLSVLCARLSGARLKL